MSNLWKLLVFDNKHTQGVLWLVQDLDDDIAWPWKIVSPKSLISEINSQALHGKQVFNPSVCLSVGSKRINNAQIWLPLKCDYQKQWQHSEECMCRLQNIAMRDYQESVTDRQTDRRPTKWSLYAAMLCRRHKKSGYQINGWRDRNKTNLSF